MNYVYLILFGVAIGLVAAVPIGPVNLICIRRSLQFGSFHGFVSGLGAALGDGLFAVVTGFGLTAVAHLIEGFSTALQLVGGLLLLSFGIRTFFAAPTARFDLRDAANDNVKSSMLSSMASTFALTISNPATLIAFTALFAGLGGLAGDAPSYFSAAFVVAGVFAGSATWWLVLTTVVGLLHARIDDRVMRLINRVSGLAVTAFGVAVLFHLILERVIR